MASNFDRWEKDPFFSAAEEVQESADRMESVYRTWIHESKDASSICDVDELRRDLRTSLGTAKWQLDEFERAVGSSYVGSSSSAKDGRARHRQFIVAIEDKISTVENSLKESVVAEGKSTLPWVRLDEGERDELALFLSGPSVGRAHPLLRLLLGTKKKGICRQCVERQCLVVRRILRIPHKRLKRRGCPGIGGLQAPVLTLVTGRLQLPTIIPVGGLSMPCPIVLLLGFLVFLDSSEPWSPFPC
ncbi:uncharacterized protein LOC122085223 isoform X2 [Macadamia integrifolia]|nr:uncharacterized protein LOC122085223 isoform X2 [Macadamia integrifolia]XP_042509644.1 uncharacterized protein LOC122085223 isoform X2 [Macadamia integrifolia]